MKKTLLIGLVFLFSISLVFAAQPLPHAFEGQIFSEDGSLTSGKTMITKLAGAVTAQTTINGNSFKITVIDNTGYGGLIEFFMGDEKADLSFYFKTFEVTKTNLTFDTIPDETVGSCGDGICAVEECSFCAIDCTVSKCKNNNVCDVAIGEDYITAPNDCSSCGDGACNNYETCSTCSEDCGACPTDGSPGGGGGSGGGGSYSPASTATTTDNSSVLNIDQLNKESNESVVQVETNKGFFSWITGFVIGDEEEGGKTGIGLIVLAIILLAIIYFILKNKKFKK